MTEETTENVAEQQEQNNEVDYKTFYEQHRETIEKLPGLISKNQELLKETKQAKEKEANARKEADRIAQEKAIKEGEFEKLWQTAKEELENERKEKQELKKAQRNEKIENMSLKVAKDLADGHNITILSKFVQESISKVAEETGELSSDVLEDIKKQYEQNEMFSSLMKGNKSVGGSAPGNTRSAGLDTKITRADFEKMSPDKQMEAITKGRQITD